MAKKSDYIPLEQIAEAEIAKFDPTVSECSYMSHGKRFTIITPRAGDIDVMIDRDDSKRGEPATISIFAKFENPQDARALGFDSNMFSGKWNHHFLWSRAHVLAVFVELRNRAFA